MDPTNPDITYELLYEHRPLLRVYKDGHVERLLGSDFVPATTDPKTGVSSKDITIITIPDPEQPTKNLTARLFLPKLTNTPQKKLPLLIYFHGGGFCLSSPFNSTYHNYVKTLVSEANVVAISVNYRKAPEHPIPAAYEDSWAAIKWIFSHCDGNGPEAWLSDHADFERVFLVGDSAGANIAHNMAMKAGSDDSDLGLKGLLGVVLMHPYFWGSDPIGSEPVDPEQRYSMDRAWPFLCPSMPDNDDPRINPVAEGAPSLAGLGCRRVLVGVAGKDPMRDRGWLYYDTLVRSGWTGGAEFVETEGEGHAFHLHNLECEKAKVLIKRLAAFFNMDSPPNLL